MGRKRDITDVDAALGDLDRVLERLAPALQDKIS
jgi:hypothetical protein